MAQLAAHFHNWIFPKVQTVPCIKMNLEKLCSFEIKESMRNILIDRRLCLFDF